MARERPIILDDDDAPHSGRSIEPAATVRTGFEWGLASTIIGAMFLLVSPFTMMLCLMLLGRSSRRSSVEWIEIGTVVCIAGALAFCITGLVFALRGLRHARQSRHPVALSLTGLLLCLAGLITWAFMGLVLLMMSEERSHWSEY